MKLHQLLAIVSGKKSQTEKVITDLHHKTQKVELLTGLSKTYKPRQEDGEAFPPEAKHVQVKSGMAIREFQKVMADLWDTIATQETTNCTAKGDIILDGTILVKDVPSTTLIFLNKQLNNVRTFVEKIPTLDAATEWIFNKDADLYVSKPHQTTKTKKVPKVFIKYEATKKHPAQTEMFHEDVVVGDWTTINFSGAIPAKEKNEILDRVNKLIDAVRIAREVANSAEVQNKQVAQPLMKYLFGG